MGDNAAARLKKDGVDISKTDVLTASVHDIFFPPREGHELSPVWHPRSELDASDPGIKRLVDEIVRDGQINKAILVREDWIRIGKSKVKVFTIVDGAGRTVAGRLAEPIMHKAGRLRKGGEPVALRVKIELFTGDNKALLIARQRADSDPSKRPHPPSVQAVMIRQSVSEGSTLDEIHDVYPRLQRVDIERLQQWENLSDDVQATFDSGAPVALLGAVLSVPRGEQKALLDKLLARGITHMKGASRALNREERPNRVQRPHPKTMQKVLTGITGLGLSENETIKAFADTQENDPQVIYSAGWADGGRFMLQYARGEVTLDALPEHVRDIAKHIKMALED